MTANDKMRLYFKKLHTDAKMPTQADNCAAGNDLYALEDTYLYPNKPTKIRTGLAMEIPDGHFGAVYVRSGISLKQVMLSNSVAVIDSSFRGELQILGLYYGNERFKICKGDRVAQIVIQPYVSVEWFEVDTLSESVRDIKGFGSSGK